MSVRTRITLAAAAALAAMAGAAPGDPKDFGTVTTVQVAKAREVLAAHLADMDGDGQADLVVATARRGKRAERAVDVHLRRKNGDPFVAAPDVSLDLPEDVSAIAVGDVHEDPGAEIVLFAASGAFAWRPKGPDEAKFARLVTGSFLWQLPDPKEVVVWAAGVRDVDGDRLADVILPEPDGWRIALQRRGKDGAASFSVVSAPRVPADALADATKPMGATRLDARAKRKSIRVQITIGGGGEGLPAELVDVTESCPAPQFLDWDGDGRLDLLAQMTHELGVWRQRDDGTFADAPDGRYTLPVTADRERRLDVSYSSLAADLDGDRRADCVMVAGDKRSDDVRTQVLVFLHGKSGAPSAASPLFGDNGLPTQLLRIAGFAGSPRFADVDGDGRPDLTLGSVRLDGALDTLRAAGGEGTVDAEIYVYRNRGNGFSDRPDLTYDLDLKADGLRKSRNQLVARFVADVTGDRVRDLLLRDEPERVRMLLTRKSKDALSVIDDPPLWEMRVDSDADLLVHEPAGGGTELLVVEDAQVSFVRFK